MRKKTSSLLAKLSGTIQKMEDFSLKTVSQVHIIKLHQIMLEEELAAMRVKNKTTHSLEGEYMGDGLTVNNNKFTLNGIRLISR